MVLSVYNRVWRLLRPLIPLILWYRTRRGKEIACRRLERYGRSDNPANKISCNGRSEILLKGRIILLVHANIIINGFNEIILNTGDKDYQGKKSENPSHF